MSEEKRKPANVLPSQGKAPEQILKELEFAQRSDADWKAGVLQSFTYAVGEDVAKIAQEAYAMYYSTNALITHAFPSVKRLEEDVVAMTASLLHAPEPVGTFTTGGTESNLLAVLAAREHARRARPEITSPEIVVPGSVHPSFDKAAHLFDLRVNRIPITDDLTADVPAMQAAITDQTILMAASAPTDTHGTLDPIHNLAPIAAENSIPFHVDACVGGYFLPFLEAMGERISHWDFRVPGVTTISADLHKHGYTAKGASILLYRESHNQDLNQFSFDDWPTGLYTTETIVGTRPGGTVAAAWAVLNYLGEDGYRRIAAKTMGITRELIDGVNAIPELEVWGKTVMNKFGYGSRTLDIFAIAEEMERRGWVIDLQQKPPGINMHVFPIHEQTVETYLSDLKAAVHLATEGEISWSDKQARYN